MRRGASYTSTRPRRGNSRPISRPSTPPRCDIRKRPPGRTGRAFRLPPLKSVRRALAEIHSGIFAAAIDLDLELKPITLVERRDPGALDGRDVDERVRLAVIALNEAEALHRVEEFNRAGGLLAG